MVAAVERLARAGVALGQIGVICFFRAQVLLPPLCCVLCAGEGQASGGGLQALQSPMRAAVLLVP